MGIIECTHHNTTGLTLPEAARGLEFISVEVATGKLFGRWLETELPAEDETALFSTELPTADETARPFLEK
jgi:hypothetical protein